MDGLKPKQRYTLVYQTIIPSNGSPRGVTGRVYVVTSSPGTELTGVANNHANVTLITEDPHNPANYHEEVGKVNTILSEVNELYQVTGPSGSGKTSLLRAIAGLWSTGKGSITFYGKNAEDSSIPLSSDSSPLKITSPTNSNGNLERPNSRGVFFLPQRPYMVLGTLAQQLLYPTWTEELSCTPDTTKSAGSLPFLVRPAQVDSAKKKSQKPTSDELIQVLKDVRIENILSRFSLDSTCEWSSVLSLGEQQRLAFARLLLSKPYLVLLDESTSALDEANEEHLYKQIEAAGITYISVGHRTSLYKHHNKRLRISTADPDSDQQNWFIEPVIEETMPSTTNL